MGCEMLEETGKITDNTQIKKVGASRFTACRPTGTGKYSPGIVQETEYGVNV